MSFDIIDDMIKSFNLSELGRSNCKKILVYFNLSPINKKEQVFFKNEPILDNRLRQVAMDSYRFGDEGFSLFIPDSYIKKVNENLYRIHLRFMKISTILLVEHFLFFNAFGIKLDSAAKKRFVLFSFVKRVYDDLIDTYHDPPEVYGTFCSGKTSRNDPEYELLAHLGKIINLYVPPDDFKNFYNILPNVHKAQSRMPENSELEHLKEVAFQKARHSFLVDSYVMIDDLSVEFVEQRKVTAELFQCTDDMVDLKEDLEDGKSTYINQSLDPEKTLRDKYSKIYDSMMKNTIRPQLYLYLMKYFMERAIFRSIGR